MTDPMRYCSGCRSDKPSGDFSAASRRCRECMRIQAHRRRSLDYEAELARQGGACAICEKPPPDGWRGKLVIDHDPATGLFRGLLCEPCNLMLGYSQDDISVLTAAAAYLAQPGRQLAPPRPWKRPAPVRISYREPQPPRQATSLVRWLEDTPGNSRR